MKKFSLKPLGNFGVNTLNKSCFLICLVATICLSACSNDDDKAIAPQFPQKQNIICNAGEVKEFAFEANTDWSLSSSAIWCMFQKEETEGEYVLSGKSGNHTVTIKVTDDAQITNQVSVAKLELTMAGQTQVIGEVTRSAEGYELKIYDEEGNELDALEAGYETFAPFKVKANFRFAAANFPEWVELASGALTGAANQEVRSGLKLISNDIREKYPVEANDKDVMVFTDESGKAFFSFPVYYKGMDYAEIEVTTPTGNKFDWLVSLDGKDFSQGEVSFKNRMNFTVKTLNDDYEVVFMEKGYDGNIWLMDTSYGPWMSETRQDGNLSITVSELVPNPMMGIPDERTGYVLVFQRAEYELIKNDLEGAISKDGEIAYKYEQNNLLIQFTQKKKETSVTSKFSATEGYWNNPNFGNPIECVEYAGGSDTQFIQDNLGISEFYEIKHPGDITNLYTPYAWAEFMAFNLSDFSEAVPGEPTVGEDGKMYLMISKTDLQGQDVIIIFDNSVGVILRGNEEGGETGGEEKQAFTIMDNAMTPISCSAYQGAFGGEQWFKDNYGVDDISEMVTPAGSVFISLNDANIADFVCYDNDSEQVITTTDIEGYEMGGKMWLNAWFGDGSSIANSTIFLIITGDDGSKHMLFVIKE